MRMWMAFARAGAVLVAIALLLLLVPEPRLSSSAVELIVEPTGGAARVLPLEMTRHVREAILDRKTIERLSGDGNGANDASRIAAASRLERAVEVVTLDGKIFHVMVRDDDGERARRVSGELAELAVARAPDLASRACANAGCSAKARVVEQASLIAAPMGEDRWLALGFGMLLALAVGFVPLAVPAREPSLAEETTDEPPATDKLPLAARPMSRTLPLDSPAPRGLPAVAPRPAELARTELARTAPVPREPARPAPESKPPASEQPQPVTSPIMGYAAREGWRADASLKPEARSTLAMELHALSSEQCVIVAVSSLSQGGDAKAKVAIELALSVSRSEDRRLLLVEADFRHPAIAGLLNLEVPEAVDFSRELTRRGEGRPSPALGVLLCTPTLHVLPALASHSGDLVLTTHFEACLTMLRDYYDLVIVHAPAASFGVYATAVADVVDAAVVVGDTPPPVFAKKSPLRLVAAAS